MSSRKQPEPPRTAEAAVRSSQVISMSLIIGLLIGGGALGFMGLSKAGGLAAASQPSPAPGAAAGTDPFILIVPILSAAMLAVVIVARGMMARLAKNRWESRTDDEAAMRRVYQGFVSMSILQAAALEGPGLLGAVATYVTGNWLMLLATLVSVVLLAALFPRTSRMDRWIDEVTGAPPSPFPSTTDASANLADDEAA